MCVDGDNGCLEEVRKPLMVKRRLEREKVEAKREKEGERIGVLLFSVGLGFGGFEVEKITKNA